MEQLVLDIHSTDDAILIKELLKKFRKVDVLSFTPSVSPKATKARISQGLKDADTGKVKPWKEVKSTLTAKIKNHHK